jgi:hypothetical protein
MDPRLRLHNAVLGLAHPTPPWPAPLAQAGYEIVRIEQKVTTTSGNVAVDLVFVARERNALLAVECKDGTAAMEPIDLVRTASISLPDPSSASLDVAYAVWESRAEATVRELAPAAPRAGTLAIDTLVAWRGGRCHAILGFEQCSPTHTPLICEQFHG